MNKALIQKIMRAIKRRLKKIHPSNLWWILNQKYRCCRMSSLNHKYVQHILQELPKATINREHECKITVTFGSRQFGNRDNLLTKFFTTFLAMTENAYHFEFLIKVDFDDDLFFFYKTKKRFEKRINLRFFPSERGRGYADMHIWHSTLIKNRNPASRALLILSEDAEFTYKHWDRKLLECMDSIPHNYFIGTPCTLEQAITIMGPNPTIPEPVYWVRGDDYPILSFKLLEATERVARKYSGWTCLGNLFNVDGFPGDILRSLWLRHKINCHMQIPLFFQRRGVFCWSENPKRAQVRSETLLQFFKKEHQAVRDEMADAIVEDLNKFSLLPKMFIKGK